MNQKIHISYLHCLYAGALLLLSSVIHIHAKPIRNNNLLTPYQAGKYVNGNTIKLKSFSKAETITKKVVTRSDEGETEKRYIFDVFRNGRLALQITSGYDIHTKTPLDIIQETKVLSSVYRTAEGIGVGSSLNQVLRTYPRSKIFYSYVCDCIWIDIGLDGIQFHIDKSNYTKPLPTHSDKVEIGFANFKENNSIQHVRIYGKKSFDFSIQDFLGRYHSQKNGYLAIISQNAGKISLRWRTGSDVYLDKTYEMILNQGQLVSKPTLEEKINLSIKTLNPKSLAIFVDDNPEFEPMREILIPFNSKPQKKINEEDYQIKLIRKLYQSVNSNISNYTIKKHTFNDPKASTEGSEAIFYIEDNQFRKVVETYYGEMGKRRMAYYFDKRGLLRFVLETSTNYNAPIYMTKNKEGMQAFDSKKSTINQNRYYFYSDNMIRWLDSKGKKVSGMSERYQQKAKDLLGVYGKYQ